MTLAQQRIGEVLKWIQISSAPRRTPLNDPTIVGPFAVIVPSELDAPLTPGFAANALPLFAPKAQCEGLALPPIDKEAPASQDRMKERLEHLLWKVQAGALPPCRFVPLPDGRETLREAMERAGATDTDLDRLPLLGVPLWALSAWDSASITARLASFP
ncbi:hypothetical protein [Sphingomonas yantingensis]|uniref:Uncharacterized protein n=1 Tax=Sphingomonas yantingensis TaxID=1241761 RepID=A0A7W9ASW7_9SPHN|nr:hypothetical protein [Sphingomonas yantingensis]MBB5699993.1 hypothetical protein [Sphingomonas yantingensis]